MVTEHDHDICNHDAFRDAIALFRCTIASDQEGAEVILNETPCTGCLVERLVWVGLMLGASDGDNFLSDADRAEIDDRLTALLTIANEPGGT